MTTEKKLRSTRRIVNDTNYNRQGYGKAVY